MPKPRDVTPRFCTVVITIVLLSIVAASPAIAGRWTHIERVHGRTACAARLAGTEVDTFLMLNRSGQLILAAGKANWRASGSQQIALRIDHFRIGHLQATAFNSLILVLIKDKSVVNRLKVAKDLYWYLPSGKYHAAVAGLGGALSWVRTCEEGKRLGPSGSR